MVYTIQVTDEDLKATAKKVFNGSECAIHRAVVRALCVWPDTIHVGLQMFYIMKINDKGVRTYDKRVPLPTEAVKWIGNHMAFKGKESKPFEFEIDIP